MGRRRPVRLRARSANAARGGCWLPRRLSSARSTPYEAHTTALTCESVGPRISRDSRRRSRRSRNRDAASIRGVGEQHSRNRDAARGEKLAASLFRLVPVSALFRLCFCCECRQSRSRGSGCRGSRNRCFKVGVINTNCVPVCAGVEPGQPGVEIHDTAVVPAARRSLLSRRKYPFARLSIKCRGKYFDGIPDVKVITGWIGLSSD